MGVLSNRAKAFLLKEAEEAEKRSEKGKYKTDLFYGGAQVLVQANDYEEAKTLQRLAAYDFEKYKTTIKESADDIDFILYGKNGFEVIVKEDAKKLGKYKGRDKKEDDDWELQKRLEEENEKDDDDDDEKDDK